MFGPLCSSETETPPTRQRIIQPRAAEKFPRNDWWRRLQQQRKAEEVSSSFIDRKRMMSRHHENCSQQEQRRRHSVVRRAQKERRGALNERPTKAKNASAFRKFKKSVRLKRLNATPGTRQQSLLLTARRNGANDEGVSITTVSRDDHETIIDPQSPPRTIRLRKDEPENSSRQCPDDTSFLPRRSSRIGSSSTNAFKSKEHSSNASNASMSNLRRSLRSSDYNGDDKEATSATVNLIHHPDPQRGIVTRQRSNRALTQMDSIPQHRATPWNAPGQLNEDRQLRRRRTLLEPKLSSSEYESDDGASSTGSCSSENGMWGTAPRRMLRSEATRQQERRTSRLRSAGAPLDTLGFGQTNSDRRITRSNQQMVDSTETPDDTEDTSAGEENPRTRTSSQKKPSNTVETSWDETQVCLRRKSLRIFLREPPVRPEELQKQPENESAVASPLSCRNRQDTESSRTETLKKPVAHVVEFNKPAGRLTTRRASQRQLFGKNHTGIDSAETVDESRPKRRRGRPRKTPIKNQDEDKDIGQRPSNRKRHREEAMTPVRRSSRVKTPTAKNSQCRRSSRARAASPHEEITDVVEPSTLTCKRKPTKFLPETPEKRGRRARSKKSTMNGGFALHYEELTDEYEAMASRGEVKHVRFGATIEMAQQAVERSIRLYENRTVLVDQDILADEKQHRKSLKSHASFETQEQMNLIEDVGVGEGDVEAEEVMNMMEELASRPVLTSDHLRIGSRNSQCRDCPLCLPHAHEVELTKLQGTTITPSIHTVDGFELDDGIVKNTLNALKRLRYSLAFVKQNK